MFAISIRRISRGSRRLQERIKESQTVSGGPKVHQKCSRRATGSLEEVPRGLRDLLGGLRGVSLGLQDISGEFFSRNLRGISGSLRGLQVSRGHSDFTRFQEVQFGGSQGHFRGSQGHFKGSQVNSGQQCGFGMLRES